MDVRLPPLTHFELFCRYNLVSFNYFKGTELDVLAAGNCILRKQEQDMSLKTDDKGAFELD